jgi:hypothetical protein
MLTLISLQKVKGVIDHLDQLLQHVICGWLVDAVDGHLHTLYSVNSSMLLWPLPSAVHVFLAGWKRIILHWGKCADHDKKAVLVGLV